MILTTFDCRDEKYKLFRQIRTCRIKLAASKFDDIRRIAKLCGMGNNPRFRRLESFGASKTLKVASCILADADKQIGEAVRLLEEHSEHLRSSLIARLASVNRNQIMYDA